ncbi:acetylcholine receptor subunit beta-type acr-2-like [Lytechinus variegatus]|uniref:acetylcholine receptor subunit beta-type acr-2-like n=1 Tax=Lytechinus variegatus TaxID=7654 RepID=UPI001BB209F2|nr:acetylcholine receptor subunit beta-type acr-2-like [Lytechinus variegatus]
MNKDLPHDRLLFFIMFLLLVCLTIPAVSAQDSVNTTQNSSNNSNATGGASGSRDHMNLRSDLFSNGRYDKSIRPVKNISQTTLVEMQFFVAQVLDVDERLETFKINAWLTMVSV